MTSSLVGSEMCIRDRAIRFIRLGGNVSKTRRAVLTRSSCYLTDFATVSYTHLTLPTICSV
eukprot:748808-Prorocentrum_lima.AAC.1